MRACVVFLLVTALGCEDSVVTPANDASSHDGPLGDGRGGSGGTGGLGGMGGSGGGGGTGGAAGNDGGDTYLPWAGGASYYGRWSHGPPSDASFFPITVWLQTPSNALRYQQVGVNFFTGLWQGPTDQQLQTLAGAGMPTICDQGGVWQSHLNDTTIRGWLQPDEPDNAQPNGMGGYDPCIPPSTIVAGYNTMNANDGTRPVMLGLGRGVADTSWVGRGTCTGRTDMYPMYAAGGDVLAYDIYPVNDGAPIEIVATGVDNLRMWSGYTKPVYQDIEASNINNTTRPSPAQIRSEVWMAIVHGAEGIQYFCHRFAPTFSETDCLDDAPTHAAMTAINQQITQLAPVLNTPPIGNGVTTSASQPVDTLLKRQGGATYLFAVEMRSGATTATFTLRGLAPSASAEVLGENRSIPVANGVFSDDFQSYAVHLYKIPN
ncbi:MAG TPA: hypothetical protein VKN99_15375 [Polyangia bacterium]|nr:hypothetical protein [Polyangia bacterium]